MKKRISRCLVTTALAVIVLAIIADGCDGQYICTDTIYQILVVNVLIHAGLWLFEEIECSYVYLEIFGEVIMILFIIFVAGFLWKWFDSISMIALTTMGIVVYAVAYAIEAVHIRNDLDKINQMLGHLE